MPAILVASKMKSGLPKPIHSAAPILHVPTARTIPQPCYLKFGNKVEVTKPLYSSQIPLKSSNGQENAGDGLPARKNSSVENGFDTQVSRHQMLGRCMWEFISVLRVCSRFSGVNSSVRRDVCVLTSIWSGGIFYIPHSGMCNSVSMIELMVGCWGMELRVLLACAAFSVVSAWTWGGLQEGEMAEMFVGCVLCVLSVGAKCKGWLVCLGWGRIAGCWEYVLCSVVYCTRVLVVRMFRVCSCVGSEWEAVLDARLQYACHSAQLN